MIYRTPQMLRDLSGTVRMLDPAELVAIVNYREVRLLCQSILTFFCKS